MPGSSCRDGTKATRYLVVTIPIRTSNQALSQGEDNLALSKAPECDMVMIGEGIEDALTAAMARPDLRALAAISVGNMSNIRLPKSVGTVMVLAQNDAEGSAADRALQAAYLNFFEQGFDVLEARVPRGLAKDLNELACQPSEGAA